jgi:hypothetical protein
VRLGLASTAAALALFHVWLLWKAAVDQSLLEPIVALKWLAAVLLLIAVWQLRRAGHLVFRGHRAGVFWLLVLLLHVQLPMAPVSDDPAATASEVHAASWPWALPTGVSLGASLALGLGLFLLAAGRVAVLAPRRQWTVAVHRRGRPLAGSIPALACRPPPLSA